MKEQRNDRETMWKLREKTKHAAEKKISVGLCLFVAHISDESCNDKFISLIWTSVSRHATINNNYKRLFARNSALIVSLKKRLNFSLEKICRKICHHRHHPAFRFCFRGFTCWEEKLIYGRKSPARLFSRDNFFVRVFKRTAKSAHLVLRWLFRELLSL